ncbi:HAD family hydrolase [Dehalobacterium formicoaceticum]|uniref:HAD family phosphatase n=1 Tax=Dehalobacterium formicoaceticum TaxID=51515 RepID=A0ABT1Y0X3_9FIRM|nr:HAD family phosphatase [Dehalobacterium formicoaceticum]MCR6544223.1 HAD family phosphatase [Dehalobacterium formicoaceticum]
MKIKYAIFDLDGTLLDSMHIWDNIGGKFLELYDITPEQELEEVLKPLSVKDAASYLKTSYALDLDENQIADQIFGLAEKEYQENIILKPRVADYLKKLYSQKTKMCVATASDHGTTEEVLDRLGILRYFEFVITCPEVGCGKESPRIYQLAAQRLGCDPMEVVIFEDALHCIKTAKDAGFYVVGVRDKSTEQEKEEIESLCDYYINSFDEMGAI